MKKIKYLSLVALMGALSLTSCNDLLDAENKAGGEDVDTHFSTTTGKAEAKTQAYYSLRSLATAFDVNCWGTDLYVPVRGKDPGDIHRYKLNSENSDVTSYYTNCYKLIQYSNFAIKVNGDGTQATAEATFLRDYGYYLLTQQFGAVPYITHYISDATRNYPRVDVETIYTNLETELEGLYNGGLLSETDHTGVVSKQAVASLLAKVYLAHGWDVNTSLNDAEKGTYTVNSTDNFKKASEWAVKAINGISLTQTFEKKWSPSNEGNAEQIFSVQYDRAGYPGNVDEGGHGLENQFGDYYGDPTSTGYKQCGSVGAQSEKALYLWSKGDERYDGTFMTKIYNYNGDWSTSGYFGYYNGDTTKLVYGLRYFPAYMTQSEVEAEFAAHKDRYATAGTTYKNQVLAFILGSPAVQYTFKTDGSYTKTTDISFATLCSMVNGGTTVKKWDDPETPQKNSSTLDYRDIVLFDLSDMYLTAAEGYLMAGDEASALNYVNQVRKRAGATTLTSFADYQPEYSVPSSFGSTTALDEILDERARELYGQLLRWDDLRRTKQLVRYNIAFNDYITSVADMSNNSGEIKWYRPIPESELGNNTANNVQNPGY
jgi:hypothetical protein